MRSRFLFLLILSSGCAQSSAGQATQPLAEVPFTLFQNAIILPAIVNGRDTVHLLLDTGWGPLALVSRAAERLGIPFDPPGPDGLGRAEVGTLAVGQVVRSRPVVELFSTAALAPLIGDSDGILATDFFRDLVVQIDYPAGVVRFFQASPVPRDNDTARISIPMVFSPGAGALPFSDSIEIDGQPVRGLFDTGGAGAFAAMPRLVQSAGLRPIPDSGRVGIGMLSGDTTVRQVVSFTRVGRISIGSFVADSPRVMIAPSQMAGGSWGHDLVIGYGFLRRYVVTFDYPGRRIVLERIEDGSGDARVWQGGGGEPSEASAPIMGNIGDGRVSGVIEKTGAVTIFARPAVPPSRRQNICGTNVFTSQRIIRTTTTASTSQRYSDAASRVRHASTPTGRPSRNEGAWRWCGGSRWSIRWCTCRALQATASTNPTPAPIPYHCRGVMPFSRRSPGHCRSSNQTTPRPKRVPRISSANSRISR